jgi:hypothetical protein
VGAAHEHRVAEDEQLGVEERREIVAGAAREPGPDLLQLGVCGPAPDRAVRARADAIGRNREPDHVGVAGEHHGPPDDHAG